MVAFSKASGVLRVTPEFPRGCGSFFLVPGQNDQQKVHLAHGVRLLDHRIGGFDDFFSEGHDPRRGVPVGFRQGIDFILELARANLAFLVCRKQFVDFGEVVPNRLRFAERDLAEDVLPQEARKIVKAVLYVFQPARDYSQVGPDLRGRGLVDHVLPVDRRAARRIVCVLDLIHDLLVGVHGFGGFVCLR